MARSARRAAATTGSVVDMAGRRDGGIIKDINFQRVSALIRPVTPGPGSDKAPVVHMIDSQWSSNRLLSEYSGILLSILYVDLIVPSYTTPVKMEQLAGIADDIVKDSESKETKKIFRGIGRKMKAISAAIESNLHYEAPIVRLKTLMYDLILYLSGEHNVDLKGLLPTT